MARSDVLAGQAFVRIFLKDDMRKALARTLANSEKALKSFGQSATALGAKVGALGATMSAPFIASIKAASDFQENMSKFETVFGERTDEVKAWGDSFASQIQRSKGQVAQFLAANQDLFVPLGFEPGAAEDLSKTVAALAFDLASFNNLPDAKPHEDLQAALTGSGEVMKKYGVLVNEAAVKQRLLDEGIDPKGATNQQKVMARLNIILAGTTAAQGDAIRTAGSFANQMKGLRAQVTDLAVEIGSALLPTITKIVSTVRESITVIAAWIAQNKQLVVVAAAVAAGVTAAGAAIAALGVASITAGAAISGVVTVLGLVGGALSALFTPMGAVTALVVAGTAAWLRYSESGQATIAAVSTALGKLLSKAKEVFAGIKNAIAAGDFRLAFEIVRTTGELAFSAIGDRARWLFTSLIPSAARATFAGLVAAFPVVVRSWSGIAGAYWQREKSRATALFDFLMAGFKSQFAFAGDIGAAFWRAFESFGDNAIQNVLSTLVNGMITVGTFVRETLSDAFQFAVRSFVSLATEAATFIAKSITSALAGGRIGTFAGSDDRSAREGAASRSRSLGDQLLAGLAGDSASDADILSSLGRDIAKATRDHGSRMADATKAAGSALLKSEVEFNKAIAELSEPVRAAFMDAFTETFDPGLVEESGATELLRAELAEMIATAAEAAGDAAKADEIRKKALAVLPEVPEPGGGAGLGSGLAGDTGAASGAGVGAPAGGIATPVFQGGAGFETLGARQLRLGEARKAELERRRSAFAAGRVSFADRRSALETAAGVRHGRLSAADAFSPAATPTFMSPAAAAASSTKKDNAKMEELLGGVIDAAEQIKRAVDGVAHGLVYPGA